jgi:osmotically-inducible protein OsmY
MKKREKGSLRFNTSGADDDLYIDIQDAIDRDSSLASLADNIHITVENEIVTLDGEVFKEQEKITAGRIAMVCAGNDNVNNYLSVIED